MADTDALRPYKLKTAVRDKDSLPAFVAFELRSVQESIDLIIQVMKKLEARMVAAGI